MSVSAALAMSLTITESLSAAGISTSNNTLKYSAFNVSKTLNASSSPTVTKSAVGQLALSSGSVTMNLAAVVTSAGATVDFTGRKIQGFLLQNPGTNANNMTFVPGASNGIDIFGASSKIVLEPGQSYLMDFANAGQTVASGDRTIDVTGTGTQAFNFAIVG